MKAVENLVIGVRLEIPNHSVTIIEETIAMFHETDVVDVNQITINLVPSILGLMFDVNLADTINGHIVTDKAIFVKDVNNAEDLFNKIVEAYNESIALTVTNMFDSLVAPLGHHMQSYGVNVTHEDSETNVEITRPGGFTKRTYYGQSIDDIVAKLTYDTLQWNRQYYEV